MKLSRYPAALALLAAMGWMGCDANEGLITGLNRGPIPGATQLVVETQTLGAGGDPDGYRCFLDGAAGDNMEANGKLTIRSLDAGRHQVELAGLAPGCFVLGDNPVTVDVWNGRTAVVQFQVQCHEAVE